MRAWIKSLVSAPPKPPVPKPFTGIGVYLTSEVHSVRSGSGYFSPAKLVEALSSILGYQTAIIERHGGVVEQFVGDCVVAYWAPSDAATMTLSARDAAVKILREKVKIPELDFCLRVNFASSDLAGAYFGPESGRRFQVIGKARDHASRLPRSSPGADCIFTDAETFSAMAPSARTGFVALSETIYALQVT